MIKIMLVDDHQIIRDGIKQLIDDEPTIQVIAEADNVKSALRKLERRMPDILITDLSMPHKNGFQLIEEALNLYPGLKFIILTMHNDEAYINKAIQSGVSAYLSKDASKHELIEAIQEVYEGETFFNSKVTNILMKSMVNKVRGKEQVPQNRLQLLTQREREIVELIIEGLSSPQIAKQLFISSRTVENHRSNIMSKLGIGNTIELVKMILEEKYATVMSL
ncbi:MAG: response regulator [Flammeovirgaceae bacterium]